MIEHHVKLAPRWFDLSARGLKPWEMRLNDRDYKVGDFIVFGEWSVVTGFTGRGHQCEIAAVVPEVPHLPDGWVVLSLLDPMEPDGDWTDEDGRYWGTADGERPSAADVACTGFNDCVIHACPGPHKRRGGSS